MYVDSPLTHLRNPYATFRGWSLNRKHGVSINCFNTPAPIDRLCKTEDLALVNHLGDRKWKDTYCSWNRLRVKGRMGVITKYHTK